MIGRATLPVAKKYFYCRVAGCTGWGRMGKKVGVRHVGTDPLDMNASAEMDKERVFVS